MMSRRHSTHLGSRFVRLVINRQRVDKPARTTAIIAGGFSFWLTLVGWFADAKELLATGVALGILAVASPILSILAHRISGVLVALITGTAWLVSFFVADQALDAVLSDTTDHPGRQFLFLFIACTVGGAEVLHRQHAARLRHADQVAASEQVDALADQVTELTMRATGQLPPRRIAQALRREGEHQLADRAESFAPQGCQAVVADVVNRPRVPGQCVDCVIAEAARRVLRGSSSRN